MMRIRGVSLHPSLFIMLNSKNQFNLKTALRNGPDLEIRKEYILDKPVLRNEIERSACLFIVQSKTPVYVCGKVIEQSKTAS